MNTATLPATAAPAQDYDIEIPTWLSSCLIHQRDPQGETSRAYDFCEMGSTSFADSPESLDLICRAFQFAYCLHDGQLRQSGEPYIAHPVAVAGILRELGGDATVIAAGFLHDVVEDTDVTLEEIEAQFGSEVSQLVEGLTKLSKFNFSSKTERQAENFRRMFLAMAQDIRVILVKLADRLHNMRTLEFMSDEKRRIKALET
ncbi:MAG: HD domain-containing protein, partial [Prochlorothrix sp.]